jgi:hypothetical protein
MAVPYVDQAGIIDDEVASFPSRFGLRAFPGETFRIERSACFWDNGMYLGKPDHPEGPMLYVYVHTDTGVWMSFAKGDPAEVRREMVELSCDDD